MRPVRLLTASCRSREPFVAKDRPAPSEPGSARIFLRQERNQVWLWEVSHVPATLRNHLARLPLCGWQPEMQREVARLSGRSRRPRDLFSENRLNLLRSGLQV